MRRQPKAVEDAIMEGAIKVTSVRLPEDDLKPVVPVQRTIITDTPNYQTWNLTLPWPPSTNSYKTPFVFRAKGKGIKVAGTDVQVMMRMVLTERGREFVAEVSRVIRITLGKVPRTKQRLAVWVQTFQPDRRLTDLDNRLKTLLDSMQEAGMYEDDEQIDDLHIVRGPVVPRKNARVHIRITEIS